MGIFTNKKEIKFIDLAMLSYPITALTLEQKLNLLEDKGFKKINGDLKVDLEYEKTNGSFYEKIINSGRYENIQIPNLIQNMTKITNDDVSWYNYYETNSEKRFDEMMKNIHPRFLVYQFKAKEKTVSYYRVVVRQMLSDVVILEVVQDMNTEHFQRTKGVGKFYVNSFLSAEDYDNGISYPNETMSLPIF